MLRIALALLVLISPAFAAPDAKQLAKNLASAADKAYVSTLAQVRSGQAAPEAAHVWSTRLLDAELATGKPAKQAFADHLMRMTTLEVEIGTAFTAGKAGAGDRD